mmetsp:Transcript_30959/g.23036  ORF Transcript_30959/g.23036 Transcript_30959/m.23036 type:complete len:149 (-) Transcript_30959:70-516(-)
MDDVLDSIDNINTLLKPVKAPMIRLERIILYYLLIGFLLAAVIAIILGIFVTPALCLITSLLYLCGLGYLLYKQRGTSKEIQLSTWLNLAVTLKVENYRVFLKKGLKLRPGYLGKWIELHTTNTFPTHTSQNFEKDEIRSLEQVVDKK